VHPRSLSLTGQPCAPFRFVLPSADRPPHGSRCPPEGSALVASQTQGRRTRRALPMLLRPPAPAQPQHLSAGAAPAPSAAPRPPRGQGPRPSPALHPGPGARRGAGPRARAAPAAGRGSPSTCPPAPCWIPLDRTTVLGARGAPAPPAGWRAPRTVHCTTLRAARPGCMPHARPRPAARRAPGRAHPHCGRPLQAAAPLARRRRPAPVSGSSLFRASGSTHRPGRGRRGRPSRRPPRPPARRGAPARSDAPLFCAPLKTPAPARRPPPLPPLACGARRAAGAAAGGANKDLPFCCRPSDWKRTAPPYYN
jgi:hypothetical protein